MLLYAIAKFVAYATWCFLGLHLLAGRPSVLGALKFGAVRWFLGLALGVVTAIGLGSISSESVATLYFGLYLPLRLIEWSIMAALISQGGLAPTILIRSPKTWMWILGGIALSFASDLASPEGMEGRFCIGRCLC